MYLGKPNTSSNIAWHRPQSSTDRIEEELIQKSTRALQHCTDPLERLRLQCLSKGCGGILQLGRIFRRMDHNGRNQINKREFFDCLLETGLDITNDEGEALFENFDKDEGTGEIRVEDIMKKIQPPMADNRRAIVEKAFRKLDKANEGAISISDIKRVFCAESNPRYMSGEESADKTLNLFLLNFVTVGSPDDAKVTMEEFMNYYSGISVSIDNDGYFDLMMRQIYKL